METIIISTDDVRSIVKCVGLHTLMDKMIDRLFETLEAFNENNIVIPPRDGFEYTEPNTGLLEWMPIMRRGQKATIKLVGYHPTNPSLRNLPTILSTISMYDTTNGHLIGIADATFLTALRTGAASAVASKMMASPDAKTVGLIGCGAQAVTQLHALSRVFDIEMVLAYDIDPCVCHNFADRTAFLDLNIQAAPAEVVVRMSDILCTATSVEIHEGPVFEDTETKPWLHINAVGSDFPGKVEVPVSLLKRAFVCPDFLSQAVIEGECQQLSAPEIGPSLVEIAKNQAQYCFVQNQVSVFDSTGWALEDEIAMEILIEYAKELELGKTLEIESVSEDPHNPYEFVNAGKQNGFVKQEIVAELMG